MYAPVVRWAWHCDGWLEKMGHFDGAGGTVVHIAAGFLGLAVPRQLQRQTVSATSAACADVQTCLITGWCQLGIDAVFVPVAEAFPRHQSRHCAYFPKCAFYNQ